MVLLHGTFSTVRSNYAAMIPRLQATGRCVYGINYGLGGLQSVRSSAQAVAAFIDQVLAVTGAEQVDVIAFSQGGLVLRTALRLDGAAPDVATAVLIAPTFHGTTSPLIASLPTGACAACADQAAGSSLLADLDAGSTSADGDLDGDVAYAVVAQPGRHGRHPSRRAGSAGSGRARHVDRWCRTIAPTSTSITSPCRRIPGSSGGRSMRWRPTGNRIPPP